MGYEYVNIGIIVCAIIGYTILIYTMWGCEYGITNSTNNTIYRW